VIEDEENANVDKKNQSNGQSKFSFLESLKHFTGNKVLDEKTIDPIMDTLLKELQARNVASDVATQIIKNLKSMLMNKKTDSFTSV